MVDSRGFHSFTLADCYQLVCKELSNGDRVLPFISCFILLGATWDIVLITFLPSAVISSNGTSTLNLNSDVLMLSCLNVYSSPSLVMVTVGEVLLPSFLVMSPTPRTFMNSSKFSEVASLYFPVHSDILMLPPCQLLKDWLRHAG